MKPIANAALERGGGGEITDAAEEGVSCSLLAGELGSPDPSIVVGDVAFLDVEGVDHPVTVEPVIEGRVERRKLGAGLIR